MKKDYLYEPDYPYKKHPLTSGLSKEGYPIIERTNNGLLFPEGPKDEIDMDQISDE
jgi:hypothetical protein